MTEHLVPASTRLPRGRTRFAAIGYALRVVALLPRPARHAVLAKLLSPSPDRATELPPVPDFVRLLEAAGDAMPELGPTRADLLAAAPELTAVEISEPVITGPGGAVPARLYRLPGSSARTALVWVHGGAFVGGSLDGPEAEWVALALAARGIPVLSVGYRKALHGTHFPAPSDDVLAGWEWAVENAAQLGVTAEQLHLGGASAGGNLVAGVAKRLRDAGSTPPASVLLLYPLVHAALPALDPAQLEAVRTAPGVVLFTQDWIADCNLNYVGTAAGLDDPYAFAANGDVSALPPTYILNCELDTLRASGEAYAELLAAAGVPVTVELETAAGHGTLGAPGTPAGHRSLDRVADWLGRQHGA